MELKGFEALKEQINAENAINEQLKELSLDFSDEITFLYLNKRYDECKKLLKDAHKVRRFLQKKVHNPAYRRFVDEFATTVKLFHTLVYRTEEYEEICVGVGLLLETPCAEDFIAYLLENPETPNEDILKELNISEEECANAINELLDYELIAYSGSEENGFSYHITEYGHDVYTALLASE